MRRYGAVSFPQGDQLQKRPEQAESVPACALCSLGFQPVLKILLLLRGTLQSWGQQTWTIGSCRQGAALTPFKGSVGSRDKCQEEKLPKGRLCCQHTLVALQCLFFLCITLCSAPKNSSERRENIRLSFLAPSGLSEHPTTVIRVLWWHEETFLWQKALQPLLKLVGARSFHLMERQYQIDNEKEAVVFFCPRIFLFSDT